MKIKKTAGKIGAVVLCIAGFLLFGSGAQAAEQTISIGLSSSEESSVYGMESMLPGESVTKVFELSNEGTLAGTFFVEPKAATLDDFAGDAKALRVSNQLLGMLDMDVTVYVGGRKSVIYQGKVTEYTAGTVAALAEKTIGLGVLQPGEKILLETTISVPAWLNNNHDHMAGKFWWRFFCNAVPIDPPLPEPEPPTSQPEKEPPVEEEERENFWKLPGTNSAKEGEKISYMLAGFDNRLEQTLYSYTVSDIIPEGLEFSGGRLPAFTGGEGIFYNIVYTTNKEGFLRLHEGVSATSPFEFFAPNLQSGEYITSLSLEFGTVPPGFAVGNTATLDFVIRENPPQKQLLNRVMLSYTDQRGRKSQASGGGEAVQVGAGDDHVSSGFSGANAEGERNLLLETLPDGMVPRFQRGTGWSLINLLLTIVAVLVSLVGLLRVLLRRRQKTKKDYKRYGMPYWLAIGAGVLLVFLFIWTQDISKPMSLTDGWTLLIAGGSALQGICILLHVVLNKRQGEPPQEDIEL